MIPSWHSTFWQSKEHKFQAILLLTYFPTNVSCKLWLWLCVSHIHLNHLNLQTLNCLMLWAVLQEPKIKSYTYIYLDTLKNCGSEIVFMEKSQLCLSFLVVKIIWERICNATPYQQQKFYPGILILLPRDFLLVLNYLKMCIKVQKTSTTVFLLPNDKKNKDIKKMLIQSINNTHLFVQNPRKAHHYPQK